MHEEVKILCVDDEKNVLRALKRLLMDSEYEIITATSGAEGLEVLKNSEPVQLVISDYRMPEMNGVDFLKEVCKLRPDTVRIVLSGYADTATIIDAINEGEIYKFIPKPWNDDEIKVTISHAIERYFLNKENIQLAEDLCEANEELMLLNKNLEELVGTRTAELMFQNGVLRMSQNVLDCLPFAVIGMDTEGLIVQCNRMGQQLFDPQDGNIVGMNGSDLFSEKMYSIIGDIITHDSFSGQISHNGYNLKLKGIHMKYSDEQEGIILVFDEVE